MAVQVYYQTFDGDSESGDLVLHQFRPIGN
jgi:hypothetical protein